MAYDPQIVLGLVKARLNRLASDASLDDYFNSRIEAARAELLRTGIRLNDASVRDQVLLADVVVWQYQNRDKPGGMPEWLRLARRERWLHQTGIDAAAVPEAPAEPIVEPITDPPGETP